ncbi:MAG: EAL domain-containing protein, partial [Paracoccaceae bacterium]
VQGRQVVLAYQPVVQAAAPDRVAFWEGFARVQDGTGRILPAGQFMAQVEETEVGRMIDCLALDRGLKALAQTPDLRLSINLSARSIGFPRWNRILRRGLARDVTVGERLILEMTEGSVILVPELVTNFMSDLRAKGIAFALDDFGAGLSAFRHFRRFQFDILKIDGQFCRGVAKDPDNQVLTRAMQAVAHHFDLYCVAEQVETAEDAAYLRDIGVDCLQGYHFAAPMLAPPFLSDGDAQQIAPVNVAKAAV